MKLRLNNLERALSRVEDVIDADRRMAEILKQVWRSEYQSRRSDEEQEHIMGLAREVHARPDDPDVLAAAAPFIAEENEYVDARTREYVAGRPPGERSRWQKLFSGC